MTAANAIYQEIEVNEAPYAIMRPAISKSLKHEYKNESFYRSDSIGTEKYYSYRILKNIPFLYTEGVLQHCQENSCFWMLDVIASYCNRYMDVSIKLDQNKYPIFTRSTIKNAKEFTYHYFFILDDNKCIYSAEEEDQEGQVTFISQAIPFTDAKIKAVMMYFINGVLMMPEEY